MDRDGRGKPPPGEFSSFDLSKMSEAEVAAELAARMARWRSAHKNSNGAGAETREPPTAKPAGRAPAPQPVTPLQQSKAEPPVSPREAGLAIAARIDRARRVAAQARGARGRGRAAREVPLAFWNWMAFTIVNAHFRELSTIMRGMTIGMRLLADGVLSMDGLVTHRYPLDQINEAFATLRDKPPGFAKAVITFGED